AALVVMTVDTGTDALVAARAAVQVDEHQMLALEQAEFLEALGHDQGTAAVAGRLAEFGACVVSVLTGRFLEGALESRGLADDVPKKLRADAHHLDLAEFAVGVIVGNAGRYAR